MVCPLGPGERQWKVIELISRYQQKTAGSQGYAKDSVTGGCKNEEPSLGPIWVIVQDMQRSSDLLCPILALDFYILDSMLRIESLHLLFLGVKKINK